MLRSGVLRDIYHGMLVMESFAPLDGTIGMDIQVWRNNMPDISEEALDQAVIIPENIVL